jgi:hypothetical protein
VRVGETAIEATVVARTGRPRHLARVVTHQGLSCEPLSVDELARAGLLVHKISRTSRPTPATRGAVPRRHRAGCGLERGPSALGGAAGQLSGRRGIVLVGGRRLT